MDRVKYRKAIMVYKSLNGLAQPYMRKMFKFVSDVSERNIRYVDKTKLYLPIGKHLKIFTDNFASQQQKCGILFPTIFVTVKL